MKIRLSNERGHADHGWLKTWHSFSFSSYHDPAWMGFHSLRVINDDFVRGGAGFTPHPHRDMEIITFVLSGELRHQDSMGNEGVIRPGDFQYMSAGSGVTHSEFNGSRTENVRLLQIWIVPQEKGAPPRYDQRSFPEDDAGGLTLVASADGRLSSMEIRQQADLWLTRLNTGQKCAHSLARGRHGWLQVAEGSFEVNGETLNEGDAAYFEEPAEVDIIGRTEGAKALLFDLA